MVDETQSTRDPELGLHLNWQEKNEFEQHRAKLMEQHARAEEAKTKRERMRRGLPPDASDAPRELVFRSLGGVQMHAIEWLWTGWIPKGYITLLAGETGAGCGSVVRIALRK